MTAFELLRIETVHPALVHLPLGIIPLALLAYLVATSKQAERRARWLFIGDFALGCAAVVTTISAIFGFISYFELEWPGALEPWPVVHLVLGSLTTFGTWVLSAFRVRARRRVNAHVSADGSAARAWTPAVGMAGVALGAIAAGYIGGEILVFHGGMAVRAGAQGMLAPPLALSARAPESLHDTMHRMRALWASSVATSSRALAEAPSPDAFSRIADDAERLQRLARWVSDWARQPPAQRGSNGGDADHDHGPSSEQSALDMDRLAQAFEASAQQLQAAAEQGDLRATLSALGNVSAACAECHVEKRWKDRSENTVSAADAPRAK